MGFRAAAIIVAALVPMIHGQTSATNVSTIPVPPTCIQPREAVDPSGADISLALTGAVASACDPSQQKTTTDGTSSTIYFTTGSYSFNISGPSHEVNQRVVPASFCPDTFNAIINTCINAPDGNSWGGWSAGGGANYSISNLIYPANGLVAASPFSATASSAEASSGAIVPSAISDIPPSSTGTLSAESTVPTTVSQPASPSAPLPGPTPGPQTGSSSASLETAPTNVSGSSVIEIGASNVPSSAGPAPSGTAVVIPGQNGAPACAYYLAADQGKPAGTEDYCFCDGIHAPLLTVTVSGTTSKNCDYPTQPAATWTESVTGAPSQTAGPDPGTPSASSSASGTSPLSTDSSAERSMTPGAAASSISSSGVSAEPSAGESSVPLIGSSPTTPVEATSPGAASSLTSTATPGDGLVSVGPSATVTPVSSATDAFAGSASFTTFPVSGGPPLIYTKQTFADLATITAPTTITTSLVETKSDGSTSTYVGPIVVGGGGVYWGPPGINLPDFPGINIPCIWPFCTGGGGGGGGGGGNPTDPTNPDDPENKSATTNPSSSQVSCTQRTVTDFWVSCSSGDASSSSCSTYSSSVVSGCSVTAETTTTAVACSRGGAGSPDDPLPAGQWVDGPDYPVPDLSVMDSLNTEPAWLATAAISAAPGSSAPTTLASMTESPAPGRTDSATAGSSTTPSVPEPTSFCVTFQDPHEGINACDCSSGSIITRLSPLPSTASPFDQCAYTAIPTPVPSPTITSLPTVEFPFTFTDINFGPIIACKSSSVGNAGGIPFAVCEGDRTTVGVDTAIAAHHSSFVVSVSSASVVSASAASVAAKPTASCRFDDSFLAWTFTISNINGWAGDGGQKLHDQENGCGALTFWSWDDAGIASFSLPFFIKSGCVEEAIASAGGPSGISCQGHGLKTRDVAVKQRSRRRFLSDVSVAKRKGATRRSELNSRNPDALDREADTFAPREVAKRGNIPSTPAPSPDDLPTEMWVKAVVPGVDQCNDEIRAKGAAGTRISLFYTGWGSQPGYAYMKTWATTNFCGQPYTHWDTMVSRGFFLNTEFAIDKPYNKKNMNYPGAQRDAIFDVFQKNLSQAFAECTAGDVYLFMPAGSGAWDDNSAWGGWEYPALTLNTRVGKIYRIDLDVSDPANPTGTPRVIWDREAGGMPSAIKPRGIRERTNPPDSPLTTVPSISP